MLTHVDGTQRFLFCKYVETSGAWPLCFVLVSRFPAPRFFDAVLDALIASYAHMSTVWSGLCWSLRCRLVGAITGLSLLLLFHFFNLVVPS